MPNNFPLMACLTLEEKTAIKTHRRLNAFNTTKNSLSKGCEPQHSIVNKIKHQYEHVYVHEQSQRQSQTSMSC